jgi:hypothetical protein
MKRQDMQPMNANAKSLSSAPSAIMARGNSETLVPAMVVAAELGIVRRTLARWREDPRLNFPQPIIINERWFFRRADIAAWQVLQANKAATVRPHGRWAADYSGQR